MVWLEMRVLKSTQRKTKLHVNFLKKKKSMKNNLFLWIDQGMPRHFTFLFLSPPKSWEGGEEDILGIIRYDL